MSFRYVEQGIAAIQAGNLDEGGRLLRIALKDATLTGGIRAIACLWLAETTSDPTAKRAYYDAALAADPDNPDIRHRVDRWIASQLPTPPPPSTVPTVTPPPQPAVMVLPQVDYSPPPPDTLPGMPAQPAVFPPGGVPQRINNDGYYRITSVIGGPNGPGTAFFVSRDGLLASTRYVVGGAETVTIELEAGYQLPGRVARSYPEIDLALIYVQHPVNELMPVTPLPRIPEETPLTALTYDGRTLRGSLRTTRRVLLPHWFPTTITQVADAGGNPVFDDNRYLVGMLTRNASASSSNLYGVHISAILRMVETFKQEMSQGKQVYCVSCGELSRAATGGGYYCECCGALMPRAVTAPRRSRDAVNQYYYEQNRIPCRYCGATVGFYQGRCLRCGREQT